MMAVRRDADRATAAHATVRHGSLSLELRPGEELTFGRGADCDIRIGHDPTDDLVSRAAGSILGLVDGALVRNTSRTQSLTFIAMPGPSFVLRPKVAIGTMPHGRVRLEVLGRHGRVYSLLLDVQGLRRERGDSTGSGRPGIPTDVGADRLSLRELRLLAALCEPLLAFAGGEPATYREIASRLGGTATAASVRTGLDRLRNRLADEGIPGLRGDEDDGSAGRDSGRFVAALARWAVDTGQVNSEGVDLLLPAR